MGSTTSKPYQNKGIASDGLNGEHVNKRDNSSGGFGSTKGDPNSNLPDQINLPSIPQTLTKTSPCKPEMTQEINTCELTEGLDDFTLINTWEIIDLSESMFAYFEPKISSPSQNASDKILPQLISNNKIKITPFLSKSCESPKILGIVSARVNSFERKIDTRRMMRESVSFKYPLPRKRKVVFYFTSLTGIPSTYEDCQEAKAILQGYHVCLDERDVSMDAGFKEELNELLGTSFHGKLPRIFVSGCFIGGVEELRKMDISGELVYLLEGCEMKAVGNDGNFVLCPGCADVRFLPCLSCSGSCRVYLESTDWGESNALQFQKCKDCNENGLIRCPVCW